MIETNDEYILPARFDDTEIEGIRPTIGFIDLRNYSPTELATLIMIKLGKEESIPVTQKEQDNTGNVYLSINAAIEEGVFETTVKTAIGINFTNTIKEDRYYNEPVFRLTNAFEGNADGLYFTDKLMPIQFPAKLEYGEVLSVAYIIRKGTLEDIWEKLPIDTEIYSIVTTTLGEKFESNRVNIERIIKSLKGK